jgi:hypothetical protein
MVVTSLDILLLGEGKGEGAHTNGISNSSLALEEYPFALSKF